MFDNNEVESLVHFLETETVELLIGSANRI